MLGRKATLDREPEEQIVLNKTIFLLPFGTSAKKLRKKNTTSADELAAERNMCPRLWLLQL